MPNNITRSTWHASRHSSLDELAFNRDVDRSQSLATQQAARWVFEPSYSGLSASKLRTPPSRGLPVTMMESTWASQATLPQCRPTEGTSWRTSFAVKQNPHLRGFVADKITAATFAPAELARPPTRTIASVKTTDHMAHTLVNLSTTSPKLRPFPAASAQTPQPLHVS